MTSLSQARTGRSGPLSIIASTLGGMMQRYRHRRTIRHLDELDDHLLRDVGITRGDIREMRRHW